MQRNGALDRRAGVNCYRWVKAGIMWYFTPYNACFNLGLMGYDQEFILVNCLEMVRVLKNTVTV